MNKCLREYFWENHAYMYAIIAEKILQRDIEIYYAESWFFKEQREENC